MRSAAGQPASPAAQAVLDGLKPLLLALKLPAAPCTTSIIDEAVHQLGVLEASVLFARYGKGRTREELASQLGLRREQISQAETRALNRIWASAASFREPLNQLFSTVTKTGFTVFELAEGPSRYFPEAEPESLWRCAVNAYAKAAGQQFVLQRLPAGGWALCDPERVTQAAGKLKSLFTAEPAFQKAESVAEQLDVDAYDLLLGWPVYDALYLTRAGLFGYSGWNEPEKSAAVTSVLAAAGFAEPESSGITRAATETDWQPALTLLQDVGTPEWTSLFTGLARSGVPAPELDDILCDLTHDGRTTGHTALALWRQGKATLALSDAADIIETDAGLIKVTPESEPGKTARLIREFTGG